MTGYGAAEGAVGERRLRIEIRTVNHRFFNPQVKLPSELAVVEAEIRDRLHRALRSDDMPDERTAALATLVAAVRMEPTLGLSAVTVGTPPSRKFETATRVLFKALRLSASQVLLDRLPGVHDVLVPAGTPSGFPLYVMLGLDK